MYNLIHAFQKIFDSHSSNTVNYLSKIWQCLEEQNRALESKIGALEIKITWAEERLKEFDARLADTSSPPELLARHLEEKRWKVTELQQLRAELLSKEDRLRNTQEDLRALQRASEQRGAEPPSYFS